MANSAPITFKLGTFKRPTINQPNKSTLSHFETSTNNGDYQSELITELDSGKIKSDGPVEVKPQLIIPCAVNDSRRFLKAKSSKLSSQTESGSNVDSLDAAAKKALLLEADQANKSWEERDENGVRSIAAIEQQTSNTFTNRLENQSENNEDQSEDKETERIENPNYEQVPIEDFGMAVMLGMGYKPDAGIGITNKKAVNVFVPQSRPRGLGLGADRKVLEKLNSLKRKAKQTGIDEKDDLCMEKGAFVQIEEGQHADQYGTVESIDEDVSRLTVSLAIGGTNKERKVISISQFRVRLVTEKEFLKYSKYVNKSKAEKVEKETSEELMKHYHHKPSKRDEDNSESDDDRRRHRHKNRHEDSKRSRKH